MALPIVGARAEVANMAAFRRDMNTVNRSVTGFTGRMTGAFASATRGITAFGTQMVMWGTRIKRVGTALTFYVTLPLVGLGMAAGRAAIDFESGMAGIRKTTDLTTQEFGELRQKILDLAMDQDRYVSGLPNAMEKMTKFGEIAGSMGIEGVDAILAFAETASLLEVTTDIIGEDAVRDMAKFIKIMELSSDETDELGSAVVNLGNNLPTTERQILTVATRLAPIAGLMGLNAQKTLAWSAAMASAGVRTQMGASAMSRVMIDVQDAVSGTTDKVVDNSTAIDKQNEKLGDLAFNIDIAGKRYTTLRDDLGQTIIQNNLLNIGWDEYKRIMDEDPGALWDAIETLPTKLQKQYLGVVTAKKKWQDYQGTLGETQQKIANLEAEHGNIVTSGNLQEIARLAGMTGDEFKQAWEVDASAAFKAFIKGLHDVHESGGDVFAILDKLNMNNIRDVQTIGTLAKTYDNLDDALYLAEEGWTGISRVQREVMAIYPEMTKKLEGHNYLMEEAAKRDKTTAAQLAKLGNTLRGVAIVLGDTFLPIVNDIVAAAIPLVKRITELDQRWIKWGLAIGVAAAAAGPMLAILGTMMSLFGLMLSPIGLVAAAVGGLAWIWAGSFDSIWDAAYDAWYYMNTYVFTPLHDRIEYLKVTLLPGLKKDWKDTWDAITNKANVAWTWLRDNIFNPIVGVITTIYNVVLATWKEKWAGTWETIRTAATTVWESLRDNVFGPLGKAIETLAGKEVGLEGITEDFRSMGSTAAGAGQRVKESTRIIIDFRDKTGLMVKAAAEDFMKMDSSLIQTSGQITTLRNTAQEMIRDAAKEFYSFRRSTDQAGEGVDALGGQFGTLGETVAGVTESILKAIENMAQQAGKALDEFAKGFAEGFDFTTWQTNLDGLISTVNTQLLPAVDNIVKAISELFGPAKEAGEAWSSFGAIVGEEVAKIPSYIETMVTTASDLLNGFAASLRGEWSEAAVHFAEAIFGPEEGEKVAEGAQNAIYWIGEFSRVMEEKTPTTLELLNAIGIGFLNTFGPDYLSGIQNATIDLGLLGEVFPGLEEKLTSWDQAFAEWVEGLPELSEIIGGIWTEIENAANDAIETIGGIDDEFIKVWEGIEDWWTTNYAPVLQPILDFINKIRGTFEEVEDDVSRFSIVPRMVMDIKDDFEDMSDGVTASIEDVESRFSEFADLVSDELANMAALAEAFGQALDDIPNDLTVKINLKFRATLDQINKAFIDIENLMFDQDITITGFGGTIVHGSYAEGGVVPGPPGAAQMAIVHGGEIIIPPGAISYQGGTGFFDVLMNVVRKFSSDMGGLFRTLSGDLVLSTSDITDAMRNAERAIDDARSAQERLRTEHESISEQIVSLNADLAEMEEAGEQSTKRYKKTTTTLEKQKVALAENEAAFQGATETLNETMEAIKLLPMTMLETERIMREAYEAQQAFTKAQEKGFKLEKDLALKLRQLEMDRFEIGTKQLALDEAIAEAAKAKPEDAIRAQIRVRRAQVSLEKERLAVDRVTSAIEETEKELAALNKERRRATEILGQLSYPGGRYSEQFAALVAIAIEEALGGRRYASGGVVSGRRGQPYLGVVHGGERILPVSISAGGGGGGGAVYQTTNNYNNIYNANYGQTQQYGSLRRDLYRWSMLNQGVA